jgi:hypothetical protein
MAEQPKHDVAIDEIKALEERRYRAMIAGDAAVLDELCSDNLIYTHSKGDHDDKRSYLHKVGSRYFTYLEITHLADRILVVDSAALVTGRMTARVSVAGTIVHIDNRYLAVWVQRLEVRRLPANPDHRRLTSIVRSLVAPMGQPCHVSLRHEQRGDGEAPDESVKRLAAL